MSTTPQYSAVSEVFCCKWCSGPVALATEPGGDLVYACVRPDCGHSVMVDCVEGLAVRESIADAAWEAADALLSEVCDCYGLGIEQPACEAAGTCVQEPVSKRLAQARSKAAWHLAGGLEIREVGGVYFVPSGTRGGVVHRVERGQCSCEAGQAAKPCWHREAVAELVSGARVAA
jgi:hypothetical protein